MALLKALAAAGYDVGPLPASGEELIRQVKDADDAWVARIPGGQRFEDTGSVTVTADTLRQWLGPLHTARIEKQWGPLAATGIRTLGDRFLLGGVRLGNVWIGVQPPLGVAGDPMRLMYERDLTPHPQYAAFYGWLQHGFRLTRCCISACTARWSGCPVRPWGTRATPGPTCCWATCRICMSMRPTTRLSRCWPSGAAMA